MRNGLQRKPNQISLHGAWAFRSTAFEQVSVYSFIQSRQGQRLRRRVTATKVEGVRELEFVEYPLDAAVEMALLMVEVEQELVGKDGGYDLGSIVVQPTMPSVLVKFEARL